VYDNNAGVFYFTAGKKGRVKVKIIQVYTSGKNEKIWLNPKTSII